MEALIPLSPSTQKKLMQFHDNGGKKHWNEAVNYLTEVDDHLGNQDQDGWGVILEFANRWARLMEAEIANGSYIHEIAKSKADDANYHDLSENQMRYATQLLIECWEYGQDLSIWRDDEFGLYQARQPSTNGYPADCVIG